jgi:hypothetical protein
MRLKYCVPLIVNLALVFGLATGAVLLGPSLAASVFILYAAYTGILVPSLVVYATSSGMRPASFNAYIIAAITLVTVSSLSVLAAVLVHNLAPVNTTRDVSVSVSATMGALLLVIGIVCAAVGTAS